MTERQAQEILDEGLPPSASRESTRVDPASGSRELYRLLHRFQPRVRPYVVAALSAVGTTVCEAVTLVLLTLSATAIAADDSAITSTIGGLHLTQSEMLSIAGVLLVARLFFTWVNAQVTSRLAAETLLEARRQILKAFTEAEWETQARQQQGIVYDILANRADVVGLSTVILIQLLVAAINIAVLTAAALVLQPAAVLALVAIGAVLAFVLRPLNRRTRMLARQYLAANVAFINRVTDLTHNTRDLAVYRTGPQFRERVMEQQREAVSLYRRRLRLMGFTPQAYQTIGLGLAVVGLAVASAAGGDNLATLGAVVLLLLRGISYGQLLLTLSQSMSDRLPLVTTLVDALEGYEAAKAPEGTGVPSAAGPLRLSTVSYRYDQDLVLDGIDLTIPQGQRLGVVGPSGSGKSTMLQILAGLRRPVAGTFSVGDVAFDDLDRSWWAEHMALVSQDAKLLTETVADNIAIYRDLPREAIAAAAGRAQLADEVEALGGYDVALSREERALSGGQLQRLAIARALAGRAEVLLLDEPTSALDVGTEARLQRVLDELHGSVTMVIVAHRLSTVASCDRILVLERGQIVADGPPEEVLERFGTDAQRAWELVELQAEPDTDPDAEL